MEQGWGPGVRGTSRPSGEDSRAPDRAGRGGGGAERESGDRGDGGGGARGCGREAAGGICGVEGRRGYRYQRSEGLSEGAATGVHAAVGAGGAGEVAADAEWKGGSAGVAGAETSP